MAEQTQELAAKIREGSGKGIARRLRAQNLIPAVIYGRHVEPTHVAVNPKEVKAAVNTPKKLNTLITLNVEGDKPRQVILKDYQRDPVTYQMLHADFIEVRDDQPVRVNVPVALVGKAEGVVAGGVLSQVRHDVEVWALPRAIPERIEADVTNLKVAQALHINDIKMPEGVTVKSNVNFTLAVITAPEAEVAGPAAAAVPGAGTAPVAPAAAAAKKEGAKK